MSDYIDLETKIEFTKNAKNKTYTFAGITLTVIIVLLVFAIQPTIGTIFKIISEVEEKKRVNTLLTDKINSVSALEQEYQGDPNSNKVGLSSTFQDLALLYPAKGDFSYLMACIDALVKKNGYKIQSISFDKADPQELSITESDLFVLKPWKILINIQGSKSGFVKLMQDIEKLPNYPTVSRIVFSNQPDAEGNLSYTLEIRVYKIEDPEFYTIDQLFTGL